jgi:hypothetical protein
MKRTSLMIVLLFAICLSGYEMDTLVDAPTAGILQRGETDIFTEFYKDNGLMLGLRIGVFPRVMVGMSYAAENVVGNKEPEWHDRVEFYAKFRVMDEGYKVPALAVGFDSQGHGRFYSGKDEAGEEIRRYDIKSKGFYLAMTKNFEFLGNLGYHLGANYSLENSDDERHLNIYTGLDKTLGDVLVLSLEYDLGINEDEKWLKSVMEEETDYLNNGYLNAGLAIYFTPNLYLQMKFNDLLKARSDTQAADRSIRLKYYFDI